MDVSSLSSPVVIGKMFSAGAFHSNLQFRFG